MIIIILSIIFGYIGMNIGGMIGAEIFIYLFGAVGILSPAFFVLEQMYKKMLRDN